MKRLLKTTASIALVSPVLLSSAMATQQNSVPEMSVSAGVAAIALLAGAVAIIRERSNRK